MMLHRSNGHKDMTYTDTFPDGIDGWKVTIKMRGDDEKYRVEVDWANNRVLQTKNRVRYIATEVEQIWLYW